jgi:hypothetical protein
VGYLPDYGREGGAGMSILGNNLFAQYYAQQNFGPRSNEVWYYADAKVTLYSETNVVSHEFADGKGVITYNAPLTLMLDTIRTSNIIDVQMPKTVTALRNNAFRNCPSLALRSIPSQIATIGNYAFMECRSLNIDSMPQGVTDIPNSCFYGCHSIQSLSFHSRINRIERYAFRKCTGLTSVTFEGTPATIDGAAFSDCTNLTTIRVPWASTDAINANAPWGATNSQIVYNYQA